MLIRGVVAFCFQSYKWFLHFIFGAAGRSPFNCKCVRMHVFVCVCVFIGLCAFASEWMRFCVHNDRKILYSQEDSGLLNRLEYCSINWSHLHDPRLNFHALYWKLCVLDFKQHTKSLSLGIFLCGCCFVISLAFSCSHVIFIICLHIVVKCDTCKYKHF